MEHREMRWSAGSYCSNQHDAKRARTVHDEEEQVTEPTQEVAAPKAKEAHGVPTVITAKAKANTISFHEALTGERNLRGKGHD